MRSIIRVILKRGRSKPFWVGHPWVFSGAIDRVEGVVGEMGGACVVVDERDNIVGSGFYNPHAKIAVRILDHRRSTDLEFTPRPLEELVRGRLVAAVARRSSLGLPHAETTAYRVCHGEGDLLGGLVVDHLGPVAVMRLRSRAMYEARQSLARTVSGVLDVETVVAVVDEESSKLEAIPIGIEVLTGSAPAPFEVMECGVRFRVDVSRLNKTDLYLTQRDNRQRFAPLTGGHDVLDLYAGVGGFGLHAARAGASSVICVDASEPSCAAATANAAANRVSAKVTVQCGDAMVYLKEARAEGRTWSRIVCDPPPFARGRAHVKDALKKLARLNSLALASLAPSGLLLTCTGSQHISDEAFLRVLTDSGHRLRRGVHVHGLWSQASDHPFAAVAEEGKTLTVALVSLEG